MKCRAHGALATCDKTTVASLCAYCRHATSRGLPDELSVKMSTSFLGEELLFSAAERWGVCPPLVPPWLANVF